MSCQVNFEPSNGICHSICQYAGLTAVAHLGQTEKKMNELVSCYMNNIKSLYIKLVDLQKHYIFKDFKLSTFDSDLINLGRLVIGMSIKSTSKEDVVFTVKPLDIIDVTKEKDLCLYVQPLLGKKERKISQTDNDHLSWLSFYLTPEKSNAVYIYKHPIRGLKLNYTKSLDPRLQNIIEKAYQAANRFFLASIFDAPSSSFFDLIFDTPYSKLVRLKQIPISKKNT